MNNSPNITQNRKATHNYFIEDSIEAGIVLEGWEIKSLRAGRANINEAYIIIRRGEIYLLGSHISPLNSTSTHINANPTRTRKLLLQRSLIDKFTGQVERAGYTLIPLDLHFSRQFVKVKVGLAKGKKQFDKRQSIKEREWKIDKQRLLRLKNKKTLPK